MRRALDTLHTPIITSIDSLLVTGKFYYSTKQQPDLLYLSLFVSCCLCISPVSNRAEAPVRVEAPLTQSEEGHSYTVKETHDMMELRIQLIPTGEIILPPGKNGEFYCHSCTKVRLTLDKASAKRMHVNIQIVFAVSEKDSILICITK